MRRLPDPGWEHYTLYTNVREAVASLPIYFRTETHISGVMATDLHTLNSVLGATIEEQVVRTLNLLRNTWDPDDRYTLYSFVRQPQTFPDVRLRKTVTDETLLGIELKGWYLLAKEEEPSSRFKTTAAACTPQDLLVIVPWVLGNVISGSPMLFGPFVESARFAAEYRNYWWQHVRDAKSDTAIDVPSGVGPYPAKADQVLDRPRSDSGGNFGRLARTGMMNDYKQTLDELPLCGIRTIYWRQFLKAFQESTSEAEARVAIDRLRSRIRQEAAIPSAKGQAALTILAELEQLLDLPG
ncbi:MAG TPA: hypothetical protein VML55_13775 [Planctomycetaceae bacterium]|nr:hypothetical protein [Planctomycetaceae bacterium]